MLTSTLHTDVAIQASIGIIEGISYIISSVETEVGIDGKMDFFNLTTAKTPDYTAGMKFRISFDSYNRKFLVIVKK